MATNYVANPHLGARNLRQRQNAPHHNTAIFSFGKDMFSLQSHSEPESSGHTACRTYCLKEFM